MLSLQSKQRSAKEPKASLLRDKGIIPAVAYGPGMETVSIQVDKKEFQDIFQQLGESSLLSLAIEGEKEEIPVMVHDVQRDPLSMECTHIDFYKPDLSKEINLWIPLVFEGEAPAVKDLSGTLVKRLSEIEVKTKPQDSPKDIRIDISSLNTFEDKIFVKDITPPAGVTILTKPDTILAAVSAPSKVEEELEKPIEDNVEDVEKVEKKKSAEEEETEEEASSEKEPKEKEEKK